MRNSHDANALLWRRLWGVAHARNHIVRQRQDATDSVFSAQPVAVVAATAAAVARTTSAAFTAATTAHAVAAIPAAAIVTASATASTTAAAAAAAPAAAATTLSIDHGGIESSLGNRQRCRNGHSGSADPRVGR